MPTARRVAFVVCCLVLVSAGCASTAKPVPAESTAGDDLLIRSFANRYADAFESENPDRVAAFMTNDFTALSSGRPPIIGREAALQEMLADMGQLDVHKVRFDPVEIAVKGDWAWAWGTYQMILRPRGAADTIPISGTFFWILQREPGSPWRIARDVSQTD